MSTEITKTYKEEQAGYFKILAALLLLTALTFIQPHYFLENATFAVQMLIGTVKAWLILMYYMHLKGEKLIIMFTYFSLFIVLVFFVIVIGFDVANIQYVDQNYITAGDTVTETIDHAHGAAESASQIHDAAAHAEPAHH
ncbi:MAG: hypothetical protein COA44_00245 [Arcobacter sp.]|nr:MAG: hypothetical protein COA44_00245 [Arcobacter sp.]